MHPHGVYLLRLYGHLTVCDDGVIEDTWDCTNEIVDMAWECYT